jgi:outer membrane receptor for ferrienterochelin and colicin
MQKFKLVNLNTGNNKMKTQLRKTALSLAVMAGIGASGVASANSLTATIKGTVVGPNGNPDKSSVITIIHEPTGSKKTLSLTENGVFNASGLRVGGPYTLVVDSQVHRDKTLSDLYLTLGKTSSLDIELNSNVERITVTGASRHSIMNASKDTIGSVYGAGDIEKAPSFDRDLKDIIRQNPLVNISDDSRGEMSVGGVNPRFNSISIDGVKQNDDFGLNDNGYPTNGSPVSLLAIDQVSVDITPFNAKASGFTGASVNAVTKSGTNEFSGEFFYEYEDDSLAGTPKREDGTEVELDYERKTFGASLGGKIIEDELFFFVAYEESTTPFVNNWGVQGSGAANELDWITNSDIQEIQDIAKNQYGVNTGNTPSGLNNDSEKLLLKLDWNINDYHRAAFTYQDSTDNSITPQNTRFNRFSLLSNWYDKKGEITSYAAQFYSDWTDEFSTQVKVSYKDTKTQQASFSDTLNNAKVAQVRIDFDDNRFYFGTDPYRHANQLENTTTTFDVEGEYLLDYHTLSFGVGVEKIDVFNQFVPFSRGDWTFDSLQDFKDGNASRVSYSNAHTGNANDAAADFSVQNLHLFVEDRWDVRDDLWINAGVRYERISTSGLIRENSTFTGLYNFSNTNSLDGKDIFLPRLGFNWTAADDLTISGGIGRYYGGTPNVWISNSYSNDGQINVRANTSGVDLTNPDFTQVPAGATLEPGDGDVNLIDPDFELPSEWRYGITANYSADFSDIGLGNNWDLEASFMYVKEQNAVRWHELYRETQEIAVGPDGRNIYVGTGERDRADIMLTNGDGGTRKTYSFSLSKSFDNGFYVNASYANQDASSLVGGTSSTANSNYEKYNTADRNNPVVGRSRYEIEHSFKLNLSYSAELFANYKSTFSLQGERSSGRPYSWVFANGFDTFGGQNNFDDGEFLAYIPTGADDSKVRYADGFSYEQLKAVIDKHGLGGQAGGIIDRNTETGPWTTRLDFKFTQEIPGFMEGHKGSVYFSVKNLLNLIDSSAGKVYRTDFFNNRDLVGVEYDQVNNQYVYSEGYDMDAPVSFDAERSSWRIKLGVNYKF